MLGYIFSINHLITLKQIEIDREIYRVRKNIQKEMPDSPVCYGFKAYSQVDEDGIIENIFNRIGEKNRIFCEIGSSDGKENNTHYLLLKDWKGIWMEGSSELVTSIKKSLVQSNSPPSPALILVNEYINKDNINALIKDAMHNLTEHKNIDFFSIDIDGNDLDVLNAITEISPRVICVEYNAKFPPPTNISIKYNPNHIWMNDDYQGASLQAFVSLLESKGYQLVCCNLSGANAFFVKTEEFEGNFTEYSVAQHYQPARYHLTLKNSGHPPSLKFLKNKINYDSI